VAGIEPLDSRRERIAERDDARRRVVRWTAAAFIAGCGMVGAFAIAAAASFAGHQQAQAAGTPTVAPTSDPGVQTPSGGGGFGRGGGFFGNGGGGQGGVAVSGGS
jgi:hypothetical protein